MNKLDMSQMCDERWPLVSIVVPVYGVEDYLDACVRSLIAQSYSNLQIILVDDGSPDRCPEMCDAWSLRDSRIEVVHRDNGGLAAARNSGLKRVRGDYVMFVDSDDWIECSMVEVLVRELLGSGADLSIVGVRYEYEDGHHHSPYVEGVRMTLTASQAFKYINLPGYFGVGVWDKLYPARLIEGLRFAENVRRSEDYRFTYEVLRRCHKIQYCSEQLYHYRQRTGSLSNALAHVSFEPVDATREMCEIVKRFYPEQGIYALYGYLTTAIAALGVASRACANSLSEEWVQLGREVRGETRKNLLKLVHIEIPNERKMQLVLFCCSPRIYYSALECVRRLHPDRLG